MSSAVDRESPVRPGERSAATRDVGARRRYSARGHENRSWAEGASLSLWTPQRRFDTVWVGQSACRPGTGVAHA